MTGNPLNSFCFLQRSSEAAAEDVFTSGQLWPEQGKAPGLGLV
jgi:hypothetical protein